jgi:F-type H+-transporting ATPase subunit b
MESLVAAVRDLLIRALPTFIVVSLLFLYLKRMLFQPLEKALQDREAATSGTRKLAEDSLKKAEAKAAEYENKLRAARAGIYKEQEEIRRQWRAEQAGEIGHAREQMAARLKDALASIEDRKQEAIAGLENEAGALADRIAHAILTGRPS